MKGEDQALPISKHNWHSSHGKDGGIYLLISHTLIFFFSLVSIGYFEFKICVPVWLVYPHHQSELTDKGGSNER